MPLSRDSGRYDQFTGTWSEGEVQIAFPWGNIPMQPDEDRAVGLDPELDSHIIATSEYQGFPDFITGGIYDDTVDNVAVPNLVGLANPTAAETALDNAGLVLGDTNSSTAGANSGNDGKVKSQSIPAGTMVNEGTTVDIVVFDNPGVAVPNLAGLGWVAANAAITGAGLVAGSSTTSSVGANDTNVNKVKSQSPTQGTVVAPGSTVTYVLYELPTTGTVAHMEYDAGSDRYFFYPVATTDYVSTGYVGRTITVANFSAIPAANGNYVIDAIVADNAWNTGGQKIWLQKGAFSWSGAGTSAGSTWTLVP